METQKILFFDTETTGFHGHSLEYYADLVQLSWIFNDIEKDYIIRPDGWQIPTGAAKVHGISQERAMREGLPLINVIEIFWNDYLSADKLVAHNYEYDIKTIQKAFHRLNIADGIQQLERMPHTCTMLASTEYCAIPGYYDDYKWPKLIELHRELFGTGFEGAHNSLNDVRATKKCYEELVKIGVIQNNIRQSKP